MSTELSSSAKRPQFRNIHVSQIVRYRMPPTALVSITHRISGGLLFLLLPLLLWLFDLSLMSELSFIKLKEVASHWFVKLILLGLIWAYIHHFCAGVRHLVMDLHVGIEKSPAVKSALAVFAVSLPLTLIAALKLFGAF